MTKIGELRQQYSDQVEPALSIFSVDYAAWAERADAWGEQLTEHDVVQRAAYDGTLYELIKGETND